MILPNSDDTIVAISTPPGHGGIGVVRISGTKAFAVANAIADSPADFSRVKSHSIHHCLVRKSNRKSVVDDVLVSVFRAPTSYTGEHVVEISAHGNPQILKQIVELAISAGARQAVAGEFTMRAFFSGRIDLIQAESVADLVAAESTAFQQAALYQLSGKLSEYISSIRSDLIEIGSLFEAYTDFPDEELPPAEKAELAGKLHQAAEKLQRLASTYRHGEIIRSGVQIPIIGPPNAGKSSLFNAILAEERAIVTEIPGTTRDTISEKIEIGGYGVRFIDTAGLRETSERIETLGVERSKREIAAASIVIAVFDICEVADHEVEQLFTENKGKNLILALNKIDLIDQTITAAMRDRFAARHPLFISAKTLAGIDLLLDRVTELIQGMAAVSTGDANVLTNQRHCRAVASALEIIEKVFAGLEAEEGYEILAFDLRQAINQLEELLGKITNDDLLAEIFSRFCIGK